MWSVYYSMSRGSQLPLSSHYKHLWSIHCIIQVFVISSSLQSLLNSCTCTHTDLCRQSDSPLKWRWCVNLGHAVTDVQLWWGLTLPLCQIYEAHSWGEQLEPPWLWPIVTPLMSVCVWVGGVGRGGVVDLPATFFKCWGYSLAQKPRNFMRLRCKKKKGEKANHKKSW